MKRMKLIDQLYNQMELDIFGKPAQQIVLHFLPIEIKAMLKVEYAPTPELIENIERLMYEFADLDCFEYAIVCRDFLHKHAI